MTTDPQPIPTPTSTATPVPQSVVGSEALAPTPAEPDQAAAPDQVAPEPTTPPEQTEPAPLPQHKIKRTRASGLWVALGFFAVVLLLLLIFIIQNSKDISISYLGAHGHLPTGVALLLAAVCGVLLALLASAARISQLRGVARRRRKADAQRRAQHRS